MAIRFTKMHGLGNDYVYVNLLEEKVKDPAALAVAVSDRHFGIGADGLILIGPSDAGDVRMRMFNADGSEAEMCGNGVRCVAKYARDHDLAVNDEVRVQTKAGLKTIQVESENGTVTRARVDMGVPVLERAKIPMTGAPNETCIDERLEVGNQCFFATCVSMGNPHCVIFVTDLAGVVIELLGPMIEHHEAFPERTNVHFAQVINKGEVRMRTWERGSGITLACGTGASAVAAAGYLTRQTGSRVLVRLPGGDLELERNDNGHIFMTGPATEVFTGVWLGE